MKPFNTVSSIFNLGNDDLVVIQIDKKINLPNIELSQIHSLLKEFIPSINTFLLNSKNGSLTYLSNNLGYYLAANTNFLIKENYSQNALSEMNKNYSELKVFKIK